MSSEAQCLGVSEDIFGGHIISPVAAVLAVLLYRGMQRVSISLLSSVHMYYSS